MKFRLAICIALVLAANARFTQAQPWIKTPEDVLSSKKSIDIRISIVALSPVYARALGLSPNSNSPENVIETARIPSKVRFSLENLAALKKAIVLDGKGTAAFNQKEAWYDIVTSAPLELKTEEISEGWKPQIDTITEQNTFPNAFRKTLRLNMTPTLHGDGTFYLALRLSKNLTFGPEKRVIHLVINPDDTNKLIFAADSQEYLKQKSVVLQSQEAANTTVAARNNETIALFNLPLELSAQEFLPNASPAMKFIILVTPHIPTENDPYVRAN